MRFKEPTGKTLEEWLRELGDPSALTHREMAAWFVDKGVPAWWAQSLTVAVEQQIGRRVVGQTCAGTFSASASKTMPGEWEATFEAFTRFMTPDRLPMAGSEPSTSATEKWRYWRTQLIDGSKVVITCQEKPGGKVTFAVNHDGLEDNVSRETMKIHWRGVLGDFVDTR
ncbi:hypothetical protein CKALI_12170 [Corynebacterium kalinowskii]|uniref:DUF4287 domain-containing protein n=1 Tax=Corynebacterium kalinowskii TaxID=2675216 RepID=A0A6B8VDG6_9CORY|nr:hypothetical protein [Corynebacterium kalinowskii]QGU03272.1 hypothetical protein CKALI_12170 [Corynebacterium kalinowskii]